MKEELGDRWLRPDLFRFGASALLTDIERQLEHHVTGRYSAAHRHPMLQAMPNPPVTVHHTHAAARSPSDGSPRLQTKPLVSFRRVWHTARIGAPSLFVTGN
jgi:hypothetical protein